MGLLDSLYSGGQGGGLLDSLLYRSPLLNQPEVLQPQYDAMGNYTGITPQAQSVFPMPQQSMPTPGQYAAPTPFNGGVQTQPFQQFAGVPVGPSASPPASTAQPAPSTPATDAPSGYIKVGDYSMPQFGPRDLYQSQDSQLPVNAQPAVGQLPLASSATPPAFLQSQSPSGLSGAARGFAANAHTGPLGALFGGVAGAMGMGQGNPLDVQRQNLKAQYEALVPLVGPQKAMLAVMNPEAGKTILAQALEKKQYGFTKLDNDTVVRTDPLSGKVEVAYGGGESNRTGVAGPDGKIIPYPEGLDAAGKKTFANEIARINADAAAGKKTEVQAKSEKFANKMEQAETHMKTLEGQGSSLFGQIASNVPLGNYAQSPEYQRYKQASSNFITALLRDESGAAIGTQEFKRYERELFPQPGDSQQVIEQKRDARKTAIDAMKKSAGPGYKPPAAEPGRVRVYNPTTGKIE